MMTISKVYACMQQSGLVGENRGDNSLRGKHHSGNPHLGGPYLGNPHVDKVTGKILSAPSQIARLRAAAAEPLSRFWLSLSRPRLHRRLPFE